MATPVKFHAFVENLAEGVHNLGSHTLKIALTNTAPTASSNTVLADITQITAANGYSSGGSTVTVSASEQTSGTYKLTCSDLTFTASGGSVGPFRYAVLYNDTPTSPADPLIAYVDYGTSLTLADGETFTVDFNASTGALTLA